MTALGNAYKPVSILAGAIAKYVAISDVTHTSNEFPALDYMKTFGSVSNRKVRVSGSWVSY